jgi:hypothetical protein
MIILNKSAFGHITPPLMCSENKLCMLGNNAIDMGLIAILCQTNRRTGWMRQDRLFTICFQPQIQPQIQPQSQTRDGHVSFHQRDTEDNAPEPDAYTFASTCLPSP